MPPTISPVPPPVLTRPSRRRPLIITALVVIIIIVAVIIFELLRPASPVMQTSVAPKLPGTLLLQVVGDWAAPTGEIATGITRYVPSSGALSSNILSYPSNTTIPALLTSSLTSPDGSHLLVMKSTGTSTELATYSLSAGSIDHPLVNAPSGNIFISPVWSSDGSQVAYFDQTSPGSSVQPQMYVASVSTGVAKSAKDEAVPLAFSPDNTSLVANGSLGFERINLADMSRTAIEGAPASTTYRLLLKASPDAAYIVFGNTDYSAAVYALSGNQLSLVGTLQGAAQIIFGPNDEFIALDASGQNAQVYRVSGTALQSVGTYTLPLSSSVYIIGWFSP